MKKTTDYGMETVSTLLFERSTFCMHDKELSSSTTESKSTSVRFLSTVQWSRIGQYPINPANGCRTVAMKKMIGEFP